MMGLNFNKSRLLIKEFQLFKFQKILPIMELQDKTHKKYKKSLFRNNIVKILKNTQKMMPKKVDL